MAGQQNSMGAWRLLSKHTDHNHHLSSHRGRWRLVPATKAKTAQYGAHQEPPLLASLEAREKNEKWLLQTFFSIPFLSPLLLDGGVKIFHTKNFYDSIVA